MPQEHYSPPLPQAHKFPRAAPKWLRHGFGVSFHHPDPPGSLQIVHFHGLWGWGRSPRYPECPWQCSSRWAAQGSRELRGVGDGFTKSLQSQRPHQSRSAGPWTTSQRRSKNTALPASGLHVPKSCPRETAMQVLGHRPPPNVSWLPRAVHNQVSVGWGQQPSCQECPRHCSTSCVREEDPGRHQGGGHARVLPDQYGLRLGPLGEGSTGKRW